MKTSTNALTQRWAESHGWICGTVQRFYGGKRHDLFGIVDSVILAPPETIVHARSRIIFAQNCSYGSLRAHREEIDPSQAARLIVHSGARLTLLEWRRKKAKRGGKRIAREWYVRQQDFLEDGTWSSIGEWSGPLDLYPKKP